MEEATIDLIKKEEYAEDGNNRCEHREIPHGSKRQIEENKNN